MPQQQLQSNANRYIELFILRILTCIVGTLISAVDVDFCWYSLVIQMKEVIVVELLGNVLRPAHARYVRRDADLKTNHLINPIAFGLPCKVRLAFSTADSLWEEARLEKRRGGHARSSHCRARLLNRLLSRPFLDQCSQRPLVSLKCHYK